MSCSVLSHKAEPWFPIARYMPPPPLPRTTEGAVLLVSKITIENIDKPGVLANFISDLGAKGILGDICIQKYSARAWVFFDNINSAVIAVEIIQRASGVVKTIYDYATGTYVPVNQSLG